MGVCCAITAFVTRKHVGLGGVSRGCGYGSSVDIEPVRLRAQDNSATYGQSRVKQPISREQKCPHRANEGKTTVSLSTKRTRVVTSSAAYLCSLQPSLPFIFADFTCLRVPCPRVYIEYRNCVIPNLQTKISVPWSKPAGYHLSGQRPRPWFIEVVLFSLSNSHRALL